MEPKTLDFVINHYMQRSERPISSENAPAEIAAGFAGRGRPSGEIRGIMAMVETYMQSDEFLELQERCIWENPLLEKDTDDNNFAETKKIIDRLTDIQTNTAEAIGNLKTTLSQLPPAEREYAEQYLMRKIHSEINGFYLSIAGGLLVPNDDTDFYILNTFFNILTRLVITQKLRRAMAMECYLVFSRVKKEKLLNPESESSFRYIMETVLSVRLVTTDLPSDEQKVAQGLKRPDDSRRDIAPSISIPKDNEKGTDFLLLPSLNRFRHEENPHLDRAYDIFEEVQERLLRLLTRLSNFEIFIGFERDMHAKGTESKNFSQVCTSLQMEFNAIRTKGYEMREHLEHIVPGAELNKYFEEWRRHFNAVWDEGILPPIVFFANVTFGKKDDDI